MAKKQIKVGTTSRTEDIFIADSSSTTGAGKTGLVFNTAGLKAYYALPRAAAVAITLATQTVTGAFSSGGFVEIDATNMPGWYRFDLPDAALASGHGSAIHLSGAANMAMLPFEIELTGWDNQDATRGGLSALPSVAAGASGGLPLAVDASGRVDVLKVNGTSQTARDLGAQLDAAISSRAAIADYTSARATKIDNLDATVSSRGDASAASQTTINANVLLTATPAQVKTQMVAALSGDTYVEPGAVPAATASLADKVSWLFTLARNKMTQTATTQLVRNNADAGTIASSTVSDDGVTFIRGKFV